MKRCLPEYILYNTIHSFVITIITLLSGIDLRKIYSVN
jgi:hypothetical protein